MSSKENFVDSIHKMRPANDNMQMSFRELKQSLISFLLHCSITQQDIKHCWRVLTWVRKIENDPNTQKDGKLFNTAKSALHTVIIEMLQARRQGAITDRQITELNKALQIINNIQIPDEDNILPFKNN